MKDRPFVDFKAIKARVNISEVLNRYAVRLARTNKVALRGNCPLPSHSSTSKNTFYANEEKSVWCCHSDSCKRNGDRSGGNSIDFVAAMEGCSPYEAAKRMDEWFPGGMRPQEGERVHPSPAQIATPLEQGSTDRSGNKVLAFTLKDVNPEHPMIQERGISVATASLYGVGYFPGKGSMAGRIVFPLHENGQLVGYAGRTTLSVREDNPKWLFGKGLRKTFLYGLERCDPAKPVILCESLWAPLWFHEHRHQAASLMGSEMTVEQERALDQFSTITIALDNDVVGNEKSDRVADRLRMNHRIVRARLNG